MQAQDVQPGDQLTQDGQTHEVLEAGRASGNLVDIVVDADGRQVLRSYDEATDLDVTR